MLMRSVLWILAAVLLLGPPARAQDAPWRSHIEALATGEEAPPERRAHVAALRQSLPDPALVEALLDLLDAYGTRSSRPTSARLAALALLDYTGDTRPVAHLLEVAVGARAGRLPQEPDLYEGAVERLRTYPRGALRAGLETHLGPYLLQVGNERLVNDWAKALLPTGSALLPRLEARSPDPGPGRDALLTPLLDEFKGQEEVLIQHMRTAEGAALWRLTLRAEALMLADWIGAEDPEVAAFGAHLAVAIARERAGSVGIPPVYRALERVIARGDPAFADARAQAQRALREIPFRDRQESVLEGLATLCPSFPASLMGEGGPIQRHGGEGPTLPLRARPPFWLGLGIALILGGLWLGSARRGSILRTLLATQAFALGILLALEGALGLADGPHAAEARPLFSFTDADLQSAPLFKEVTLSRRPYLTSAQPWVRFQEFPAKPSEDPLRIALLGASSIHAPHYVTEETLAPRLAERLAPRVPDREVEVLNAGLEGAISYGILRAGIYAMDAGSDLLVVYYGHNEVARFLSLAQYEGFDARMTALRVVLGQSALFSRLLPLLKLKGVGGDPEAARLREEPPDAETLKDFKRLARLHLKLTLGRLLALAAERGVGVVIVTPVANLPCSMAETPFTGTQRDPAIVAQAAALASAGSPGEARALLQLRADTTLRGGEITGPIIEALGELAEDYDVPLLSGEAILYGDPEGPPASALFWDNLHPTPAAYDRLADALAEVIPPYVAARER